MTSLLRALGPVRAIAWFVLGFLLAGGLAAALLMMAIPEAPIPLNIRWKAEVTDAQRATLEQEFQLIEAHPTEGTTWAYRLTDPSTASIRRIVQHPLVDDTAHINRVRFRPEFAYDRTRRIFFYSGIGGAVGAMMLVMWAANRHRPNPSS